MTRLDARHTRRVARRLIATLAATATVSGAATAVAQEPGVHIDPESPTAKEYAIPLEDARRQADPSRPRSAPVVQGSRSSPLFGAGVSAARPRSAATGAGRPRSGAGDSSGDAGGGSSASGGRADGTGSADRSAPVTESVIEAAAQPGAPAGGGGSTALWVGLGAVVLGLGAAGGVALRRRMGR